MSNREHAWVIETTPVQPEVLTVEEAAEFLRIGQNQLYDAIGRGDVPHQRIGRTIRLSRTALVRWLAGEASREEKSRSASQAR